LLAAKSISYTNPVDGGFSGVYFAELIKRLGITEKLAPKTKLARGGTSSGALVASGEADIAIQTTSDLVPTSGIEIVGLRTPERMYGPPPRRKRKVKVAGWSAQMYTAFIGTNCS
jgi:hypothetical protein